MNKAGAIGAERFGNHTIKKEFGFCLEIAFRKYTGQELGSREIRNVTEGALFGFYPGTLGARMKDYYMALSESSIVSAERIAMKRNRVRKAK